MPVLGPLTELIGSHIYTKIGLDTVRRPLPCRPERSFTSVRKYNYACNNLPIDVQFELFDSTISPIVLYGADIWGIDVALNHMERIDPHWVL